MKKKRGLDKRHCTPAVLLYMSAGYVLHSCLTSSTSVENPKEKQKHDGPLK